MIPFGPHRLEMYFWIEDPEVVVLETERGRLRAKMRDLTLSWWQSHNDSWDITVKYAGMRVRRDGEPYKGWPYVELRWSKNVFGWPEHADWRVQLDAGPLHLTERVASGLKDLPQIPDWIAAMVESHEPGLVTAKRLADGG